MKLQNNFTTPEQSKRLLELGVPADSADGHYHRHCSLGGNWEVPRLHESENNIPDFNAVYVGGIQIYYPLWTVGRLIELLVICAVDKDHVRGIIEDIANYAASVETYVNVMTYLCKRKELNFLKLEE